MLFEIHDIILHRLWKLARRSYYDAADFVVTKRVTKQEYQNWRKLVYSRFKLMKLTEGWYMNHIRRCPHALAN